MTNDEPRWLLTGGHVTSLNSPIVVLDSGLGGLTVVRSLRGALAQEDILYFGDTARVPYGSKSAATVTTFVRQIIAYLQPYNPKHIVIACNTATALAQYARVICRAAPLLVPIIEEGRPTDDPVVSLAVRQYLKPLIEQQINVLVLGCTHYPIYKELIAQAVGPSVAVIDSADKCAEDVQRRLRAARLERPSHGQPGTLRCFVTDESPRFAALAGRFLGLRIDEPAWVSLDDLHAASGAAAAETKLRPAV
jgi:glutamate racemase